MKNETFSNVELAGIKLKNRIIRSATHEGLADELGFPSDRLKDKYIQLAKGQVGAIITGYAGVTQNGKSSHFNMLMINRDSHIEAYKKLVNAVHDYHTPIIMQLAHCGRLTRSKITREKPVSPSAIRDKFFDEETPDELSEAGILKIVDCFVKAIARASLAGFDGVQLHIAHGYLLAQFLSGYTNRRKDKWGGSLENRYRIIQEIFLRARQEMPEYPIFAKINAYDGRPNGMRIEEAILVAKLLEKSGCSGIEISCGDSEDGFFTVRSAEIPSKALLQTHYKFSSLHPLIKKIISPFIPWMLPALPKQIENYNVDAAAVIKKNTSIPIIVVGGIHSRAMIEEIIDNRKADFVSMSRPFILEPNLVREMSENKHKVAKCIHCNYCTIAQFSQPTRCYFGKI